jgi:hypothetical protein
LIAEFDQCLHHDAALWNSCPGIGATRNGGRHRVTILSAGGTETFDRIGFIDIDFDAPVVDGLNTNALSINRCESWRDLNPEGERYEEYEN